MCRLRTDDEAGGRWTTLCQKLPHLEMEYSYALSHVSDHSRCFIGAIQLQKEIHKLLKFGFWALLCTTNCGIIKLKTARTADLA